MWSYWWKCLSTFCSRSWGAADSSCDLWRAVRVKTHCSLRREHLVAYQVPRLKKMWLQPLSDFWLSSISDILELFELAAPTVEEGLLQWMAALQLPWQPGVHIFQEAQLVVPGLQCHLSEDELDWVFIFSTFNVLRTWSKTRCTLLARRFG